MRPSHWRANIPPSACAWCRKVSTRRTLYGRLSGWIRADLPIHSGETGTGRTLGELVAARIALVAVCRRCQHRRVLYPGHLAARYGENFPAIELRKRLRCTACRMSVRVSAVTWAPASVSTLKRSKVVAAAAWRVTSVKRD